ncbi:MAG: hypothetical protein L0387_22130, partial [Acidobacteria bacterium]|nr:hypothetical protein [Acidobacteriota bacterium]
DQKSRACNRLMAREGFDRDQALALASAPAPYGHGEPASLIPIAGFSVKCVPPLAEARALVQPAGPRQRLRPAPHYTREVDQGTGIYRKTAGKSDGTSA